MSQYYISIFAICLVGGLASLLSYGSGRAEKLAVGIVTLYVIVSPIVGYISEFDADKWLDSIKNEGTNISEEYSSVIEDAFGEGISLAISEEFSISKDDIRVRLYGFDSEKMQAEKIKIVLSGRASMSDYKAVERYIDSLNLGECDVEIEIG